MLIFRSLGKGEMFMKMDIFIENCSDFCGVRSHWHCVNHVTVILCAHRVRQVDCSSQKESFEKQWLSTNMSPDVFALVMREAVWHQTRTLAPNLRRTINMNQHLHTRNATPSSVRRRNNVVLYLRTHFFCSSFLMHCLTVSRVTLTLKCEASPSCLQVTLRPSLTASWMLIRHKTNTKQSTTLLSSHISLDATIFLWIQWWTVKRAMCPRKSTENAKGPNLACQQKPTLDRQGRQARLSSFQKTKLTDVHFD